MNILSLFRVSLPNPGFSLFKSLAFLVMGFAALFAQSSIAQTGYTVTSPTSVQFYANNSAWADVHYIVSGASVGQQNFRMTHVGNNNIFNLNGLTNGAVVRYFFTIVNATGGAVDTPWAQFTMGNGNPTSSVATSTASSAKNSSASSSSGSGKTLVWSDEFNSINNANWGYEVGGGGFGNSEREYYTNGQNIYIQYDSSAGSNVLMMEARKENPANYGCWYGKCEYTSARLNTSGKKTFKYGRIEARMKVPQTQGLWPAFWMLGSNIGSVGWPACGEIDIMEHVGFEPQAIHGSIHGPNYYGNTPFTKPFYFNEWVNANYHVYAVEWDTNAVNYFVDGNKYYTVTRSMVQTYGNWVFDQPMYLILNLAVGGQWPGYPNSSSSFPQRLAVDYIRVYQ